MNKHERAVEALQEMDAVLRTSPRVAPRPHQLLQWRIVLRDALAVLEAYPKLVEALEACEENLRVIHDALGSETGDAPMPKHSSHAAWNMARIALQAILDAKSDDA